MSECHLEVDVHEVLAFRGARQGDVDAFLQAPPQGLINVPGKIGGRQHHDLHVLHQSAFSGYRLSPSRAIATAQASQSTKLVCEHVPDCWH